jgi:hypothetical protein
MSKTEKRILAAGISALAILAALACGGNETQTPPAQTGQNEQPAAAPADQGQAAGVAGQPPADQQQPGTQQNPQGKQGTQPGQQPQQQPNTPPPSGN